MDLIKIKRIFRKEKKSEKKWNWKRRKKKKIKERMMKGGNIMKKDLKKLEIKECGKVKKKGREYFKKDEEIVFKFIKNGLINIEEEELILGLRS